MLVYIVEWQREYDNDDKTQIGCGPSLPVDYETPCRPAPSLGSATRRLRRRRAFKWHIGGFRCYVSVQMWRNRNLFRPKKKLCERSLSPFLSVNPFRPKSKGALCLFLSCPRASFRRSETDCARAEDAPHACARSPKAWVWFSNKPTLLLVTSHARFGRFAKCPVIPSAARTSQFNSEDKGVTRENKISYWLLQHGGTRSYCRVGPEGCRRRRVRSQDILAVLCFAPEHYYYCCTSTAVAPLAPAGVTHRPSE